MASRADYVIALRKNAKTHYEQASEHLVARATHLPTFSAVRTRLTVGASSARGVFAKT